MKSGVTIIEIVTTKPRYVRAKQFAVALLIILGVLVFDIRTPKSVAWKPVDISGKLLDQAPGLIVQEQWHGSLWASDGFSIYQSKSNSDFEKIHTVTPPISLYWIAYSRSIRR